MFIYCISLQYTMITLTTKCGILNRMICGHQLRCLSSIPSTFTLKDVIKEAATKDVHQAMDTLKRVRHTVDIPDWGVVKLCSIALARNVEETTVIEMLDEHFEETGGERRIARKASIKEDQIVGSLQRTIKNRGFLTAKLFYIKLVKLKFCSNRDVFIAPLIEAAVTELSLPSVLSHLEDIISIGRVKSLTHTAYILKKKAGDDKEMKEKVSLCLSSVVSPYTHSLINGFIPLENGQGLQYAEQLHSADSQLSKEELKTMLEWAGKWKVVSVMDQLLLHCVPFKLSIDSKVLVYDGLVRYYGKREDLLTLEGLLSCIQKESELEHFKGTILKIRHFYRCANRMEPPLLDKLMGY